MPKSDAATTQPTVARPRKRARKGTTLKDTDKSGGNKLVRGRRGVLTSLLEMPVDIMYEVFERLEPYDLLRLARTTKSLRKLLMHRSAASIWSRCRKNVFGLPACPMDLSEPQYAHLMFDQTCNFCGTKNVQYAVIIARVRSCRKCGLQKFRIMDTNVQSSTNAVMSVTPHTLDIPSGPAWMEGRQRVYVSELHRLEAEYISLESFTRRQEWLATKKTEHEAKLQTAHIYSDFLWEQIQKRTDELDAVRKRRVTTIIRKLKAGGWRDELKNLDLNILYEHPEVGVARDLTERSWKRLQPILVEFMKTEQKKRLEFMFVWRP